VLDTKPRILVLALSPNLWAAYSTQTGQLWKVWSGGVKLEGAVFTTKHGPQPTSKGDLLQLTEAPDQPWQVIKDGVAVPFTVQYNGHKFEGDGIVLSTTLVLTDGTKLEVEERPEVALVNLESLPEKGKKPEPTKVVVGLKRNFTTNATGYEVKQFLMTGSQRQEEDLKVEGGAFVKESKKELYGTKGTLFGYSGWLTLQSNTSVLHRYQDQ
jgi:cytochrome c